MHHEPGGSRPLLMNRTLFLFVSVFLGIGCTEMEVRGEVHLPACFSDHMVLQREMKVPIWGTAEAGEKVTVSFAGQQQMATASDEGKWMVRLNPIQASAEGRELKASGTNTVAYQDVLVGEVWLAS